MDEKGDVISPFSLDNCIPVSSDKTLIQIKWQDGSNFKDIFGKTVRFRFHMKNGSMYSFWVSPDKSGGSYGFVGAGGPGFTGPQDTVCKNGYIKAGEK